MMTREALLTLAATMAESELAIMKSKNQDYSGATNGDPFANFRASKMLGVDPKMGVLIRLMDKVQRIASFITRGELAVKNESVDDAISDIRNYAVLLQGMVEEERATNAPRHPCVSPHCTVEPATQGSAPIVGASAP